MKNYNKFKVVSPYVFGPDEWVVCNPEGKHTGLIGYVIDWRDNQYVMNGLDGEFTCEPRWMRRLSNEDVLSYLKSFRYTFICSHTDLMDDIPEQLGLFKE